MNKRIRVQVECKICNGYTSSLGHHLKVHKIEMKDYYDKYIKSESEGICIHDKCNKGTRFHTLSEGYSRYCSYSCEMKYRNSDIEFKNKLKSLSPYGDKISYLSRCINKGISHSIVYFIKLEDCFKLGVCFSRGTSNNFKSRLKGVKYLSYELYIGTIEDAAEFEYGTKISYIPVKNTEYFSLNVYEEIKNKLPNTILPYSTQVI